MQNPPGERHTVGFKRKNPGNYDEMFSFGELTRNIKIKNDPNIKACFFGSFHTDLDWKCCSSSLCSPTNIDFFRKTNLTPSRNPVHPCSVRMFLLRPRQSKDANANLLHCAPTVGHTHQWWPEARWLVRWLPEESHGSRSLPNRLLSCSLNRMAISLTLARWKNKKWWDDNADKCWS